MVYKYVRISENDSETSAILCRDFLPPFRTGYLKIGDNEVIVPDRFLKFSDAIARFDVRDDDVWVVSHPKTGTTWTQEMVWCISNDLDFDKAMQCLTERFPFFENSIMGDYSLITPRFPDVKLPPFVRNSIQYVTDKKSTRFIKTHLPWSLLPQQIQDGVKSPKCIGIESVLEATDMANWGTKGLDSKLQSVCGVAKEQKHVRTMKKHQGGSPCNEEMMVYIYRDPKDTCISYYHHCKLLEGYRGTFRDFCQLFIGDSLCFAPFWSHVLGFWSLRHQPNILFVKFEDLKKDLPSVIRDTAKFIGKSLTNQQVSALAHHLSFENMKKNKAVNREEVIDLDRKYGLIATDGHFMRRGEVGEWRKKMSTEVIAKFDEWTKERLHGIDFKF